MRERRSNSFVRERGLVSRRLLSTTLSPHPPSREFSIPNSRHETSKESVRRGMKGDSTDKAGRLRTVADRSFFAGQPSNFTTLPAFFLPLLLPSRRARLCSPLPPSSSKARRNPTRWRSIVIVPLETLISPSPPSPSPLNIKLTSNRIEEPRASNFSFCNSGSQSHRRRELNFAQAAPRRKDVFYGRRYLK